MHSSASTISGAVLVLLVCLASILPSQATLSPEEKYYDREVLNYVANWLIQAVRNHEDLTFNRLPEKRNSEIINSILGLPKNLNDAGRK